MNLLTQLRKDPQQFEAESAAVLAAEGSPPITAAVQREAPPDAVGRRWSPPDAVVNGRAVRPDAWWQDCLVGPGEAMWPPDVPDAGNVAALDADCRGPADVPPQRPPVTPAAPCGQCGGAFFWGDRAGRAHCCECAPIPLRRVASGECWRVAWVDGRAEWRDWSPKHWRPFAHLEAAERARGEKEAAADAAKGGGF